MCIQNRAPFIPQTHIFPHNKQGTGQNHHNDRCIFSEEVSWPIIDPGTLKLFHFSTVLIESVKSYYL